MTSSRRSTVPASRLSSTWMRWVRGESPSASFRESSSSSCVATGCSVGGPEAGSRSRQRAAPSRSLLVRPERSLSGWLVGRTRRTASSARSRSWQAGPAPPCPVHRTRGQSSEGTQGEPARRSLDDVRWRTELAADFMLWSFDSSARSSFPSACGCGERGTPRRKNAHPPLQRPESLGSA